MSPADGAQATILWWLQGVTLLLENLFIAHALPSIIYHISYRNMDMLNSVACAGGAAVATVTVIHPVDTVSNSYTQEILTQIELNRFCR